MAATLVNPPPPAPSPQGGECLPRLPPHEVVSPRFADPDKPQPLIEPLRRIEFFYVDRQRLAGFCRLVEEILHQRRPEPLAAVLRQQRDVDDAVLARPAVDIEAPGRLAAAQDDQPLDGLV